MSVQGKILLALCLLPIAVTAVALLVLPKTIALHFGLALDPDGYGSKYLMSIDSALILAMNLVLFFAYRKDEKRWDSGEASTKKRAATKAVYFVTVILLDAILVTFMIVNL
ncbi:MAG: DUF1648 domain-containing protein [Clostridiales Family XIII bacterium]|nr:DUF1648 domain-containing protein [Clostridiales Family XIII bacterium]